MPPPVNEYPMWAEKPLVAPDAWQALPQTLVRPPMGQIMEDYIAFLCPSYAGIPIEHIQRGWTLLMYRTLGVYAKVKVNPPKTALPEKYNMLIKDIGIASLPTHFFGVYQHASSSDRTNSRPLLEQREVELYPVHAVIWATYATRLPFLTNEKAQYQLVRNRPDPDSVNLLRMTVVPVALPCPTMFWPLHVFVYMRLPLLFARQVLLIPQEVIYALQIKNNGGPEGTVPPQDIADHLAETHQMKELLRLAKNVYGAYQNMVALGIVSNEMWDALDFAWGALRQAMAMSAERNDPSTA